MVTAALLFSSCTSEAAQTTPEQPVGSTDTLPSQAVTPIDPGIVSETLTLWIPPFLSAENESQSGQMLAERVLLFEEANPEISISLRIKDDSGSASLLASLAATNMAAPSALPDIIALDPTSLGEAALRELIYPLDSLFNPPSVPDLYDHTLPAAFVGDNFYGLPFVSETELFVYQKDTVTDTPLDWAGLLSGPISYLFPAGDKLAKFTFAQYLSQNGALQNNEGDYTLDERILSDVLDFYSLSREAGILSLSALQLSSERDTWSLLEQSAVQSALIPLDAFILDANRNTFGAQSLPTLDGEGIIMTHTYAWAVVTKDPVHQAAAVDFLNWLLRPDFLGPWSQALGLLPATSSALSEWPESNSLALVNQLIRSAVPRPDADVLNTLGPIVQLAIEEVLFGRQTPEVAAQQAINSISNP